ncbi:MAG: hypothetical protein HZA81_02225 [Candidatus Taylorbacteria bacterium]|nr:hypothetical protein [Candidatus Taylorbacteria bacterium]
MNIGFHRNGLPHRLLVCTDKVLTPDLDILRNRLVLLPEVERVDHAKSAPKQVVLELSWAPSTDELSRLKPKIVDEFEHFFREKAVVVPYDEICEDESLVGTREE